MKYAIGIDLGGTDIKAGIINTNGKILFTKSISTDALSGSEKVILNIKKLIAECLEFSKKEKIKISGIGLGSPGLVDDQKGIIIGGAINISEWKNIRLANILKKEFKLNTYLDNDVNMVVLGEYFFGAGKNTTNCVCITLGTGIGGGIIIDKKLYRGSFGFAGEIGHISIIYEGLKCNCGGIGCLEAYAGKNAFIEKAKMAIKKGFATSILKAVENDLTKITPKIICDEARNGDHLSKMIVQDIARYIGAALASVINILNPEIIIIGGGISHAGDLLLDPIKDSIKKFALDLSIKNLKIVQAKLGNNAGIFGSCAKVFSKK
ncbi:MAG: ROK family glucokinase [bacterium]